MSLPTATPLSRLRVLLVEDDRELRQTLREALAVEGHEVFAAASLADARALWATQSMPGSGGIDLVLLDLGLPDADGQDFLAELRARRSAVPLIVISARDAELNKIALLDAGADDYLVKPFGIGELLARIRVALRHRGTALAPALTRYERDGLLIDLARHTVSKDGRQLHLTPTEYKLLARLTRSAGQVLTHRQLLAEVWGPEFVEHTHYLRLYMGQLRAKIERDSADPRLLLTETGIGYRLVEPQ